MIYFIYRFIRVSTKVITDFSFRNYSVTGKLREITMKGLYLPSIFKLGGAVIGHVITSHHAFKMAVPLDVNMKQRTVIGFLTTEKVIPVDIHKRLKNVYGDSTMNVSTVRHWAMHFKSRETDINDKSQSGLPATAVTPENQSWVDAFDEDLRNQIIIIIIIF